MALDAYSLAAPVSRQVAFPQGILRPKLLGLGISVTLTVALVRPQEATLSIRGRDPREHRTGIPLTSVLLSRLGACTRVCTGVWTRPSV